MKIKRSVLLKTLLTSAVSLSVLAVSLPFIPVFTSGSPLISVPEGTTGRAAALIFAREMHAPAAVFSVSFSAASLMYGPAKPGCYRPGRTSAFGAMRALCRGDLAKVTITEGMTSAGIARLIASSLGKPDADNAIMKELAPAEGTLFPATYLIRTADPSQLSDEMKKKFRLAAKDFTREELIIASIVQKEAKYRKDFRRCAGVIRNRLSKGMMLECDSVYQYVLGPVRITKDDIAKDSPYNDFRRKGLPPTPICSPGLAALEAAKNPEQHAFYYFVAKKTGELYFSKDRHEHFRAVEFFVLNRPNGFRPKEQ